MSKYLCSRSNCDNEVYKNRLCKECYKQYENIIKIHKQSQIKIGKPQTEAQRVKQEGRY